MGYIKHHAIIVVSWDDKLLKKVHAKAKKIFKEKFAQDELVRNGEKLVSPIIDSIINSYQSFFIAPDGSKEGYNTSTLGNDARDEFIKYIKSLAYSDGSNAVNYTEVFFGEDNNESKVLRHN